MAGERIVYRGVSVTPDWPDKIRQAQLQTTVEVNGVDILRVRYGEEKKDCGADTKPCHDCAVVKGEFHVQGCDVERCRNCGGQLWFGCECDG